MRKMVTSAFVLFMVTISTAACTQQVPVAATSSSTPALSSTPAPNATTLVTTPVAGRTVTRVIVVPTPVVQRPATTYSNLRSIVDSASLTNATPYITISEALFFDSPSNNVGCYMTNDGAVNCAIHSYEFPQPGPDCNAGIAVAMDTAGYASLTDCGGYFPVKNRGYELPYGQALENDGNVCASEQTGIYCMNTSTGNGFSLSRQAFTAVH